MLTAENYHKFYQRKPNIIHLFSVQRGKTETLANNTFIFLHEIKCNLVAEVAEVKWEGKK